MNELAKPEYPLAAVCGDALANELEVLFAGTKSYGRTVSEPVKAAWILALRAANVTLAELQIAVEWWVAKVGGETPEPRALVAFIEEKRVDVERLHAMRAAAAVMDAEQEEELRLHRIQTYGTELPTREQRKAHWERIGMTLTPDRLLQNKAVFVEADPTPEESERKRRMIDELREST